MKNISPTELNLLPKVKERVRLVKEYREKSPREATKKLAAFPSLFGEIRQPETDYILIPRHSSEIRPYVPIGFFDKDYIASDSCLFIANASLYHFGVMTSQMHTAWVKNICGRIKSDYRYSNDLVYNNFPWPENPNEKQIKTVEEASENVLVVRAKFPESSSGKYTNS